MWAMYALAAVPVCVWALLWARSNKITGAEAIMASIAGVLCCVVFHVTAIKLMTDDVETWSGRVSTIRYDSPYTQWYMQRRTRTKYRWVTKSSGTGKNRRTWRERESYEEVYYTRETRHVGPSWSAEDTLFRDHSISREEYERHVALFGGQVEKKTGLKDNYDSGDPYSYLCKPTSGYVWPAVTMKHWENRVKATPSLFSFAEVPEGAPVYEYPRLPSWNRSERLLGSAAGAVSILEWDQMNARLGPRKWVNVIAIGFGDRDKSVALLQQAKWVGGKQNDLVLCYGGPSDEPTWALVFGWTESEVCKRNLETILLDHGFQSATLPRIESEIERTYEMKDFRKFDYLTVEPPAWAYAVLIAIVGGSQLLMGLFLFKNEIDKTTGAPVRRFRYHH